MTFGEMVVTALKSIIFVTTAMVTLCGLSAVAEKMERSKYMSERWRYAIFLLLAVTCLASSAFFEPGVSTKAERARAYESGYNTGDMCACSGLSPALDIRDAYREDTEHENDRYLPDYAQGYIDGYYDQAVRLGYMKKLN